MKILVEIDLGNDIQPNDVYKINSGWFNEIGYIDIPLKCLNDIGTISDLSKEEISFRFKYIKQVHKYDEISRP